MDKLSSDSELEQPTGLKNRIDIFEKKFGVRYPSQVARNAKELYNYESRRLPGRPQLTKGTSISAVNPTYGPYSRFCGQDEETETCYNQENDLIDVEPINIKQCLARFEAKSIGYQARPDEINWNANDRVKRNPAFIAPHSSFIYDEEIDNITENPFNTDPGDPDLYDSASSEQAHFNRYGKLPAILDRVKRFENPQSESEISYSFFQDELLRRR